MSTQHWKSIKPAHSVLEMMYYFNKNLMLRDFQKLTFFILELDCLPITGKCCKTQSYSANTRLP